MEKWCEEAEKIMIERFGKDTVIAFCDSKETCVSVGGDDWLRRYGAITELPPTMPQW